MRRTYLVGLENNIPNSFLNGIVFFFWCISGLKERIMSHICDDPLCVACELRFLFRMFDQGLATKKEVCVVLSSHHIITSHHFTSSHHITHLLIGHRCPRHQLLPRARSPHRHHRLRHSGRSRRNPISVLHSHSLTSRRAERFIHYALNQMVSEAPCVLPVVSVSTLQTNTCSLGHTNTKTNTTLLLSLSWYGSFVSVIHQVVLATALRLRRRTVHHNLLVVLAVVRVVPQGGCVSRVEASSVSPFLSHSYDRSTGQ